MDFFDNDTNELPTANEGAGLIGHLNKPIVADDFITNPSNEEIHHHHHHPTVAIGKFVYLASDHLSVMITMNDVRLLFVWVRASQLTLCLCLITPAQKDKMCTVNCRTAWDACCRYGMPNPYNCLSNNGWLSHCSTKCNNCYKTCGSSGLCPTPWGEKETTNEVTMDFDNNNDGVERSGRFINPL
jgi:hypothetical protein